MSLFAHIVSIDQGANGLQWAEGVVLSIVLTTAGIPDQVAALLISQDISCGSLRKKEQIFKNMFTAFLHVGAVLLQIITHLKPLWLYKMIVTHLWYSSANYKPGFLAHRQEVVAQ